MTGTRAGTRLGNARPLVGSRVAHLQQPSGDSDRDLLLDRVVLLRSQDQYEALPPRTAPEHNVTGGHAVKRKLSHGAGVRTSQGAGDRQVRSRTTLGLCQAMLRASSHQHSPTWAMMMVVWGKSAATSSRWTGCAMRLRSGATIGPV